MAKASNHGSAMAREMAASAALGSHRKSGGGVMASRWQNQRA